MCSAAGIGVASFAQNFMSSRAQASAQYESEMASYNNAMARWEIEKRQANDRQGMLDANAILQLQQLQARQQEINSAAAEDKSEIALAAMRAKAAAELSAGEANISGLSADRVLAAIESEATRRISNVESTRENQISAAQMDKYNTVQGAKQLPIYGLLPSMPEESSPFGSFLSAALNGLGAAYPYMNTGSLSSNRCGTPAPATSTCSKRIY